MNLKKWTLVLWSVVIMSGCAAVAVPIIETYETYNLGKGGIGAAKSLMPIGFEEEKSIGGSLASYSGYQSIWRDVPKSRIAAVCKHRREGCG